MRKKIKYILLLCVLSVLQTARASAAEAEVTGFIYHTHSGNGNSEGGCYVKHTKTDGKWGYVDCGSSDGSCGHGEMGPNVCNRQIWKYKEYTVTYYAPNCGLDETTELFRISCKKDTSEWSKQVILMAEAEPLHPAVSLSETPFIWNQGEAVSDHTFEVTENGIYTLELKVNGAADAKKAELQIEVDNIDSEPPDIKTVTWNQEKFLETVEVVVEAWDTKCGLHDSPYSFDGGVSWQESPFCILANGEYEIAVRDRLGNESRQSIVIDNIDNEAPVIEKVSVTPSEWTNGNVSISITAADYQKNMPSGTEPYGCGLHDSAYSFDDGNTWQSGNTYTVEENQAVLIAVRDKMGHIRKQKADIHNIDKIPPRISLSHTPETWTEGKARLNVHAYDEESGLNDCPFSWDGGKHWDYPADYDVEESGEYRVMVRDKAGNVTAGTIYVEKEAAAEEALWNLPVTPVKYREPPLYEKSTEKQGKKAKEEKQEPEAKKKITKKLQVTLKQQEQEQKQPLILKKEEAKEWNLKDWIIVGMGGIALAGALLFVFWYFVYTAVIETVPSRDDSPYSVRIHIFWKKGELYCRLPKRVIEKEQCSRVRLLPGKVFLFFHEGKKLLINTGEGEGELPVRAEMKLRIKAV